MPIFNWISKVILTLLVTMGFRSSAQNVSSKAYDLMLSGLLSGSVEQIDAESLKDLSDQVVLLDARAEDEFMVSHLESAIHVGYKNFDLACINGVPKDAPIVVYCSVGYRSEKIGEQLQAKGYSDVKNLYGGIFEWVNAGYPVYTTDGERSSTLHAYDHIWSVWVDGDQVNKVYTSK